MSPLFALRDQQLVMANRYQLHDQHPHIRCMHDAHEMTLASNFRKLSLGFRERSLNRKEYDVVLSETTINRKNPDKERASERRVGGTKGKGRRQEGWREGDQGREMRSSLLSLLLICSPHTCITARV